MSQWPVNLYFVGALDTAAANRIPGVGERLIAELLLPGGEEGDGLPDRVLARIAWNRASTAASMSVSVASGWAMRHGRNSRSTSVHRAGPSPDNSPIAEVLSVAPSVFPSDYALPATPLTQNVGAHPTSQVTDRSRLCRKRT